MSQTYLDSALNLLDVPMWNYHLWRWKCTSAMLSVWRIYYCRFKIKKDWTEVSSFVRTDSMSSEQRQKLAKERREERARYIGKSQDHQHWLGTFKGPTFGTRWIHLLFCMSFLLCRSAVNDGCCRFLLFFSLHGFQNSKLSCKVSGFSETPVGWSHLGLI